MDKDTTAQSLYALAEETRPDAAFAVRLEREVLARWNAAETARNLQPDRRRVMFKRLALAAMAAAVVLLVVWAWPLWPGNRDKADLPLLPRLASASGGGEMVGDGLLSGAELLLGVELPKSPDRVPVYTVMVNIPDTPDAALAWARDFGLPDPQVYRDPREPEAIFVVGNDGRRLTFRVAGPTAGIHYYDDAPIGMGAVDTFADARDVALAFLRQHNLLPPHYHVEEESAHSTRTEMRVWLITVVPELDQRPLIGHTNAIRVAVNETGGVTYLNWPLVLFEALPSYPIKSAQEAWDELLAGGAFRLDIDYRAPADRDRQDIRSYRRAAPARAVDDAVTISGWAQVLIPEQPGQLVWAQVMAQDGAQYRLNDVPNTDELMRIGYNDLRVSGVLVERLGDNTWRLVVQQWEAATDAIPLQSLVGTLYREDDAAWLVEDNGARYPLPEPPAELENGARIEVAVPAGPTPGDALDWQYLNTPPYAEQGAVTTVSSSTVSVVVRPEETGTGEAPSTPEPPFALGQTVEVTGVVAATLLREGDREWIEVSIAQIPGVEYAYPLTGSDAIVQELAQLNRLHARIQGQIVPATVDYWTIHGQAIEVTSLAQLWPEEQRYMFLGTVSLETLEGQSVAVFTECSSGQQYILGPDVVGMHQEFEERIPWQGMQVRIRGAVHPFETAAGLPLLQVEGLNSGSERNRLDCAAPVPLEPGPQIIERDAYFERAMQTAFIVDRVELAYYYETTYAASSPSTVYRLPSTLIQPVWIFSGVSGDGLTRFTAYVQAVREDYVADAGSE